MYVLRKTGKPGCRSIVDRVLYQVLKRQQNVQLFSLLIYTQLATVFIQVWTFVKKDLQIKRGIKLRGNVGPLTTAGA